MDFVFRWTCFSCFFRSVPNEAKDRYDESTGSEERERETPALMEIVYAQTQTGK